MKILNLIIDFQLFISHTCLKMKLFVLLMVCARIISELVTMSHSDNMLRYLLKFFDSCHSLARFVIGLL